MKCCTLALVVLLSLVAVVAAQSRKKYDHFYIDNKRGKAVALVFSEREGVGCSDISSANGTVASVTWDVVVKKFNIRLGTGTLSVIVPDDVNEISNGLLYDVFRKGNRVRMAWRKCGSGFVPDLISVKSLP